MLRDNIEREVWTCERPDFSNSKLQQALKSIYYYDVEETFEYPCWGLIDW